MNKAVIVDAVRSANNGATVGIRTTIETITSATYSVLNSDYTLLVNTSSNNVELTLPSAAADKGMMIVVKNVDATNTITIKSASGNIEGTPGTTGISPIPAVNNKAVLQFDGTNWWIIAD